MPSLDWTAFEGLPGSKSQNFEYLCRALVRLHFGRYGQFAALKNQPGVEFHLKLSQNCPALGEPPRWYGWQCKLHELTSTGDLRAAGRKDIEDSIAKTEEHLPNITDWVLWTPYTLSKKDQEWFRSIHTKFELHQWVESEIDTYLNGPALFLRNTYFGDLIATPEELERRHRESIQPIRERWLGSVHQSVDAERIIRRMLGEPDSWSQMIALGRRLKKAEDVLTDSGASLPVLEKTITPFIAACSAFADTLLNFHRILADGDLDIIQQKLGEGRSLIDMQVCATPRRLRAWNLPIALDATNALDDMRIAQKILDEVEEFLGVGLVAVLADAGGGKTQMAAQLTAPHEDRPAGILLHGCGLHKGQTLDDLARQFSINGNPITSMERLLASLDAAGKRARCRLPVIIDGLNEAENPKDWRAPLAKLSEIVKEYPNVLVVCTLRTGEHRREDQMWRAQPQINTRESFAVMALPEGLMRIESEGFGGDVNDAIKKYFNYFKINPGTAKVPVEFLQHPLNLRIFCEVTNPKRESEVVVDYFPATLSPLFEKYVANACERISQMANLSYSYSTSEVESAIYKFGLELWKSKQREISEANYRAAVSDTARPWDSSIVNLLAQEWVIYRNPGAEPDKYVITPAYDALGGYVVANSLLAKYASDRTFEWLKKSEVIMSFGGDDSHELASDILKSLAALAPRRLHGSQLWKETLDPLRNAALMFTTELEPKYLDDDTLAALLKLFRDNPKARSYLFSRLQRTRGAPNHPLNAEFLDSALRTMPVSERDLSWTEWIRGTRREKLDGLHSMELRWKEDLMRTHPDRLRAKWVMWLLTSTDRELRDVATRALYWYGRGSPAGLFEECLRSLEINDPYVPERMLAASYGVAMAKHVDIEDKTFVSKILPEFSRELYNSMFSEKALFSTTHSLMREYACRIIELTSLHHPGIFLPAELQRSKPPFIDGGLRKWGESETLKEECFGLDSPFSPFHMDFENYTLGRLVPNRRNYDYENDDYRRVRAQVLWRVEQLGWSSDLFKDIDRSIANEQYYPRIEGNTKRIERYGKKYSLIAFLEMSGLLQDQGILEDWRERASFVDIDPSFPERVATGHPIKVDFLGDPEMDMKEWIANGPLPNVNPYLRLKEVHQFEGPWIALDGFAVQEDEKRCRSSFCFIRSFLVANHDADYFLHHLRKQDLGGRWLPENPKVIYTFAGEIPWCDTFPNNGSAEFSFVKKEEIVKVQRSQQVLYLDGEILGSNLVDLILHRISDDSHRETEERFISDEDFKRIEVREMPVEVDEVKKEYTKFETLIPVCDFSWEGDQTAASDARYATTLAKEISSDLELIGQPQTFDLFTKDGLKATLNVSDQRDGFKNNQSMFFIKENLLKTYLDKNDLVLIWAIWGERGYSSDQINKLFHGPNHPKQSHAVFGFVSRYE